MDKVGIVIIACWHEVPEAGALKRMILGRPSKLESQFRLTYNMILNLLRVEDFKVSEDSRLCTTYYLFLVVLISFSRRWKI